MEESINMLKELSDGLFKSADKSSLAATQYSPLALAYIGDSVFDVMIKTYYVAKSNKQVEKYHKEVTALVKAKNQAKVIDIIIDELLEDELAVYKRGRNATTHSKAKNATMAEYRKATGFEALIGYLYLNGNIKRLDDILQVVLKIAEVE